jgi:CRP/FNR family cyclic AMP-dependent transcriptional regulator
MRVGCYKGFLTSTIRSMTARKDFQPPRSPSASDHASRHLALPVWPWTLDLSPDQAAKADASLIVRHYQKGDYVCRAGGLPDYWYGVVDGLVKMSSVTREGQELSFIGIATGGWFGEGTLLKEEKRRYDIVALRESVVAQMPRGVFLGLVNDSPQFARWVLFQLNERLSQFVALLANDRVSSNGARVARTIAWMFNPYLYPGMAVDIPITQHEIAHLASLSRARTHEALHQLESRKLIRIGYGHVTVLDIEGLRTFDD